MAHFTGQVGNEKVDGYEGSLVRLRQLAAAKCSQFDRSVAVKPVFAEPDIEDIASRGKVAEANRLLNVLVQPWRRARPSICPTEEPCLIIL